MAFDFAAQEMAPNMAEWDQKVGVFLGLVIPTNAWWNDFPLPFIVLTVLCSPTLTASVKTDGRCAG